MCPCKFPEKKIRVAALRDRCAGNALRNEIKTVFTSLPATSCLHAQRIDESQQFAVISDKLRITEPVTRQTVLANQHTILAPAWTD